MLGAKNRLDGALAANNSATFSSHSLSMSSKVLRCSLSISSTAITSPFRITGTTISEREALLQAICPGNFSTSSTTMVCFVPSRSANSLTPFDAGAGQRSLERTQHKSSVDDPVEAHPPEVEGVHDAC